MPEWRGTGRCRLTPGRLHVEQFLLLIPPKLCETGPAMKRNGRTRQSAAPHPGLAEEAALRMEEKSKEFVEKGAEVCAKA